MIHARLRLGSVVLMLADRLDGWPLRPGLLQVWVQDVATVLERAVAHGAITITGATPFYGETALGRMLDPWRRWQVALRGPTARRSGPGAPSTAPTPTAGGAPTHP